jgi:hypothetical protein
LNVPMDPCWSRVSTAAGTALELVLADEPALAVAAAVAPAVEPDAAGELELLLEHAVAISVAATAVATVIARSSRALEKVCLIFTSLW